MLVFQDDLSALLRAFDPFDRDFLKLQGTIIRHPKLYRFQAPDGRLVLMLDDEDSRFVLRLAKTSHLKLEYVERESLEDFRVDRLCSKNHPVLSVPGASAAPPGAVGREQLFHCAVCLNSFPESQTCAAPAL
jgi:hypothetical protein